MATTHAKVLDCFGVTYEGLKLQLIWLPGDGQNVLELPMRV